MIRCSACLFPLLSPLKKNNKKQIKWVSKPQTQKNRYVFFYTSDLNIFTCDGTSVTELQLHPGVLVIAPSWPRLEVLTGTHVCGWPEHPVLLAVFVPEGWSVQTRNPQDVIAICLRIRGKEWPMKWLYGKWEHSLQSSLNFLLPLLKSSFFSDKEPLSKEDGLKVSGCDTSPSCPRLSYMSKSQYQHTFWRGFRWQKWTRREWDFSHGSQQHDRPDCRTRHQRGRQTCTGPMSANNQDHMRGCAEYHHGSDTAVGMGPLNCTGPKMRLSFSFFNF